MSAQATRLLLVFLLVIFAFQLAVPTEAAESVPSVIMLSGTGGSVTVWPARHRAELTVEGAGSAVFENARVTVRASRITVTGRTSERTLFAWANRTNDTGAIGLLVRSPDRRRRAEPFSVMVDHVVLDGVREMTRH